MNLCQGQACPNKATIDERDDKGRVVRRYCDEHAWVEIQRRIAAVRRFVLAGTALPMAKVAAIKESYG